MRFRETIIRLKQKKVEKGLQLDFIKVGCDNH